MQGAAPPTSTSMRATLHAWPEPEPHGLREKSIIVQDKPHRNLLIRPHGWVVRREQGMESEREHAGEAHRRRAPA